MWQWVGMMSMALHERSYRYIIYGIVIIIIIIQE